MAVVVVMASGAVLIIWFYKALQSSPDPELLERVLFSIQQQAGVMAALSAAIFAVIAALKTGKASFAGVSTPAATIPTTWGRPAGLSAGTPAT